MPRSECSKVAIPDLEDAMDAFGIAAQCAYYGMALEQSANFTAAEICYEDAKNRFHASSALGYEIDATASLARCRYGQGDLAGSKLLADQVWAYLEQNSPSSMEFPILGFKTCVEVSWQQVNLPKPTQPFKMATIT